MWTEIVEHFDVNDADDLGGLLTLALVHPALTYVAQSRAFRRVGFEVKAWNAFRDVMENNPCLAGCVRTCVIRSMRVFSKTPSPLALREEKDSLFSVLDGVGTCFPLLLEVEMRQISFDFMTILISSVSRSDAKKSLRSIRSLVIADCSSPYLWQFVDFLSLFECLEKLLIDHFMENVDTLSDPRRSFPSRIKRLELGTFNARVWESLKMIDLNDSALDDLTVCKIDDFALFNHLLRQKGQKLRKLTIDADDIYGEISIFQMCPSPLTHRFVLGDPHKLTLQYCTGLTHFTLSSIEPANRGSVGRVYRAITLLNKLHGQPVPLQEIRLKINKFSLDHMSKVFPTRELDVFPVLVLEESLLRLVDLESLERVVFDLGNKVDHPEGVRNIICRRMQRLYKSGKLSFKRV